MDYTSLCDEAKELSFIWAYEINKENLFIILLNILTLSYLVDTYW